MFYASIYHLNMLNVLGEIGTEKLGPGITIS